MTDDDFAKFKADLVRTAMVITGAGEFKPARQVAYFSALRDLPFDDVARALQSIRANRVSQFFPTPGEIRLEAVGSEDERAVAAWGRMLLALERYGCHTSVDFQDPILHMTIEHLGGWPALRDGLGQSTQDLSYKRHEFMQTYKTLSRRPPGRGPKYLPGVSEIANEGRGGWLHGIDHVDHVLVLDGAARAVERKALMAPPTPPPAEIDRVDVKALVGQVLSGLKKPPEWAAEASHGDGTVTGG